MPEDAAIVRVADAITAAIAGHNFGIEFVTERSYADWKFELDKSNCLRVDVVPMRHTSAEMNARGGPDINHISYQCVIGIGIRKRFDQGDQEAINGRVALSEIDRLVLLTEQIHGFVCSWEKRNILAGITWEETEIRATYVGEHLRDWRQYTGLIDLTFTAKVDVDTSSIA
jgi:hypothetical protein